MIRFDYSVNRDYLNPKDEYIAYEETLRKEIEELKVAHRFYSFHDITTDDLFKRMWRALEQEIKYCMFHRNMLIRMRGEAGFNQWVFTRKQDIKSPYEWRPPEGDEWTRTNGRINATIRVIRGEKSTSVRLTYKNDSAELEFINSYDPITTKPRNLKNEDSINRYIEELKQEADTFLSDRKHMYPKYNPEMQSLKGLNKLLIIEEATA